MPALYTTTGSPERGYQSVLTTSENDSTVNTTLYRCTASTYNHSSSSDTTVHLEGIGNQWIQVTPTQMIPVFINTVLCQWKLNTQFTCSVLPLGPISTANELTTFVKSTTTLTRRETTIVTSILTSIIPIQVTSTANRLSVQVTSTACVKVISTATVQVTSTATTSTVSVQVTSTVSVTVTTTVDPATTIHSMTTTAPTTTPTTSTVIATPVREITEIPTCNEGESKKRRLLNFFYISDVDVESCTDGTTAVIVGGVGGGIILCQIFVCLPVVIFCICKR